MGLPARRQGWTGDQWPVAGRPTIASIQPYAIIHKRHERQTTGHRSPVTGDRSLAEERTMQPTRPERVTVVGTGSWGTTLGILSARQGLATNLLARTEQEAASLRDAAENTRFLPGQPFPSGLTV